MIRLYHSPLSRSVRVLWLLEELGIPYELEAFELADPAPRPFAQPTPSGKVPTLEDGDVTMFESGAILEYLIERYGEGRLAPPADSPLRASFLQWLHFAEGTLFPGMGNIAWHTRFRRDAERIPDAMADYRAWATAGLEALERALDGEEFLLGDDFSAADVQVGYTAFVGKAMGLVPDSFVNVNAYLQRLGKRPAFRKALST